MEAQESSPRPLTVDTIPLPARGGRISLWVKIPYTLFLCVLVPYYWVEYTPWNFLWFCDVALLVTLIALWTENRFLASTQLVAIGLPQMLWVADFLAGMAGLHPIGLATYMFDPGIPVFVRGLSLFHGWLPFLLAWMVWRLGYDRRAWLAQIVLGWVVLLVCYWFSPPPPAPPDKPNAAVNVNWVFGRGDKVQEVVAPEVYLAGLLAFYPICIYLPSHLLFRKVVATRRTVDDALAGRYIGDPASPKEVDATNPKPS